MADTITIKQGEAREIFFTVKKADRTPMPLTGATYSFVAKKLKTDEVAVISKNDGDFTKDNEADGQVSIVLSAVETARLDDGFHYGEFTANVALNNVIKSSDIIIKVVKSVSAS